MIDTNGNDWLDNGRELLSDFSVLPHGMLAASGLEALSQYDSNEDGAIDASDPIWSHLRIGHDYYNPIDGHPGDPDLCGRISTLDEIGTSAIYLDSQITNCTDSATIRSRIKT